MIGIGNPMMVVHRAEAGLACHGIRFIGTFVPDSCEHLRVRCNACVRTRAACAGLVAKVAPLLAKHECILLWSMSVMATSDQVNSEALCESDTAC